MPWFHATFDRHIPSILKHGLGGATTERNNPASDVGVYLAGSVEGALAMLFEWYFRTFRQTQGEGLPVPSAFHDSVRIIVIDDGRLRASRLTHDASFPDQDDIRRYVGVIDVTGMPILDLDAVTPDDHKPGSANYEALRRAWETEDHDALIEMLGGPESAAAIFGIDRE